MSESDDKKEKVEMEEVSSDEDLGVDEINDGEGRKPNNLKLQIVIFFLSLFKFLL